ncbi:MAG: hypothetical protein QOF89_1247 [Acidobacteriota bacterium]|jgi:hypothetical protein|nr:hypothetical protein [Acidobacteriota bacterium]
MKSLGVTSALLLLSLITPRLATAQTARGSYKFLLEDELIKSVDFDASTDAKGSTTGQMTFTDQAAIADVDDAEDPRAGDPPPQFYVKAKLDVLTVEKNRALMSGTVVDSSHGSYIGKWVQLVVEDNGYNNREAPDRLTWTFCRPQEGGWIPSDAELDRDDGAFLSWWATDAERDDDVGVQSTSLLPKEDKGCLVRPLRSYSFADLWKWEGDIIVKP